MAFLDPLLHPVRHRRQLVVALVSSALGIYGIRYIVMATDSVAVGYA